MSAIMVNMRLSYPIYLYPQKATKSKVLISAMTLQMQKENKIATTSTKDQEMLMLLAVMPELLWRKHAK
jgi:hypothetical protein